MFTAFERIKDPGAAQSIGRSLFILMMHNLEVEKSSVGAPPGHGRRDDMTRQQRGG
jgi:hypothetical protein